MRVTEESLITFKTYYSISAVTARFCFTRRCSHGKRMKEHSWTRHVYANSRIAWHTNLWKSPAKKRTQASPVTSHAYLLGTFWKQHDIWKHVVATGGIKKKKKKRKKFCSRTQHQDHSRSMSPGPSDIQQQIFRNTFLSVVWSSQSSKEQKSNRLRLRFHPQWSNAAETRRRYTNLIISSFYSEQSIKQQSLFPYFTANVKLIIWIEITDGFEGIMISIAYISTQKEKEERASGKRQSKQMTLMCSSQEPSSPQLENRTGKYGFYRQRGK